MAVKKEVEVDRSDTGDKASVSLAHKMNLGNYQTMDFYAGVTVTRREDESHEDMYSRAWKIVEDELDASVDKARGLLNKK